MQNVSINIDIYAKKAFVLFSPTDGGLADSTLFPMDIAAPFVANGYVNYVGVFTKVFNEMLLLNDITEANIRLSAPTECIALDYISVPNLGGKKNDDNLMVEAKKLFPSVTKPSQINMNIVKTTKTQVTASYSICNTEDIKSINKHLVNTNHNLSFYTNNAMATACIFSSIIGGNFFMRDNVMFCIDIGSHKTECVLINGNTLLAQYCIPYGTELFSAFTHKDFSNYRMFNDIEKHIFKWQFQLLSFINHCKDLGLPDPKKGYVRVNKEHEGIVALLNRDSSLTFEALNIPEEYKIYENNLALLSLFLDKTDKQYNFLKI